MVVEPMRRLQPGEQYANATWQRRADAGFCPRCGKRPPRDGRMDCEVCGEKQRIADEVRRIADPEAKQKRNREYHARRCRCGCGEAGVMMIGERWYCRMTYILLTGKAA